jgi:DHA1 family bicyclomycin/chloramphenicol resistance-like MFS transporter
VYGWLFAFLSLGLIGASQVNSLLLRRYRSEHIVLVALGSQLLLAAVLLGAASTRMLGLGGLVALLFGYLSCLGFISSNTSALALAPFTQLGGSAAALMGALQMGMGALTSMGVSLFHARSVVPLAALMAAAALLALVLLLVSRQRLAALSGGAEPGR